jgi:hypothetical protein
MEENMKLVLPTKIIKASKSMPQGNYVEATVGGLDGTPIPVLVDPDQRICIPKRDVQKS